MSWGLEEETKLGLKTISAMTSQSCDKERMVQTQA